MAGPTQRQKEIGKAAIRRIREARRDLPVLPNPFEREPFRHEHRRTGTCVVCGREITEDNLEVDGLRESA